ncbi:MAG: FkbM family methyltransferase [Clostridia bacterium]|nr:FkbM family methyltransferase [Clostridia bacterium]
MTEFIRDIPLWDRLKETDKPILLYGMGNGADMIIEVLESLGLSYCDTFASDGFVRGHHFHGKKVLSYSEAKEKYGDFITLMTFAVHDEPTLMRIREMSTETELYSPTVPVAGKGLFTYDYLKDNAENFRKAYGFLEDEKSRESYVNILNFKTSGKTEYLFGCHSEKSEVYSKLIPLSDKEIIVDLGAYDGDTIREFLTATEGRYEKIYALEPDAKNFRKLTRKTEGMEKLELFNIGAWDKKETLFFDTKGGRNSHRSDEGSPIEFDSVDNLINDRVTLLKMDIEGAELQALCGAERTIRNHKPKLYVCAYHRNEDMFALPFKIRELCEDYRIFFRQHPYIPAWEANFYATI